MEKTPKSLRLQIAVMGRVNAGKSSFLNLVCGQDVAITSEIAGTTTDVVEKAQELLPIGPVLWLDTAGLGDGSALGDKREEKTRRVFERANIILLVCEGNKIGNPEKEVLAFAEQHQIPVIKIFNKADLFETTGDGINVVSTDKSSRNKVLNELKDALIKICPSDFLEPLSLCGDLVPPHSQVLMLIPIDMEAPKGRLIMPQVQAIRDCLDNNQIVSMVKENDYCFALDNLKTPPSLVICDSQVVDFMVKNTPENILCTTFSVLFARLKGDLNKFVEGAATIAHLQDGDKVLIAESCTHHAVEDDIGRGKIPRWLLQKTGKNLIIEHASGCDFPDNLGEYKLVVQCGGCMNNRREILSRINKCEAKNVPITNYGVCISELKDVLARVLEPLPQALETYRKIKD